MEEQEWIPATIFCESHQIDGAFIEDLAQYGLVELRVEENKQLLPFSSLPQLEKMLRLHFDLGINYEGLDTVMHMLERMERMQMELARLRNKAEAFEWR